MAIVTHDIVTGFHAFGQASDGRSSGLGQWIGRVGGLWRARINERRTFAMLDQRDRRDLGLSQWTVETELAKPFWRG